MKATLYALQTVRPVKVAEHHWVATIAEPPTDFYVGKILTPKRAQIAKRTKKSKAAKTMSPAAADGDHVETKVAVAKASSSGKGGHDQRKKKGSGAPLRASPASRSASQSVKTTNRRRAAEEAAEGEAAMTPRRSKRLRT